jgi:hypothetical protein
MELVRIQTTAQKTTQCNANALHFGKVARCHHAARYVIYGATQQVRFCPFHASTLAKELAQELFHADLQHWYEKD